MKKVLFISNIGLKKNTVPNGVNIKNRHILKYLTNMSGIKVEVIDTDNWKIRILLLFLQILVASFKNDKIVLSINTNSAYKILKFLHLLKMDNKLIYFVVGGSLHYQLSDGSLKIKYYRNISKIYVQTKKMEREMKKQGLKNVEELPNSKYSQDIQLNYMQVPKDPIKCFYLGRIHPDKGIDMIFESFEKINIDKQKFKIDFYGPIENSYKDSFIKKVNKYSFANFIGTIDLIDNTEGYYRLSEYDLFIFPTFWHGEGFPGVVIDSFISGVPVLASDWNHNVEIIKNGYNGVIFESKNTSDLIDKLNYVEKNKSILMKMRKNAHNSSLNYKSENVLKVLNKVI